MVTGFCNDDCRAFALCSQPCVNVRLRNWSGQPISCEKPTTHYHR